LWQEQTNSNQKSFKQVGTLKGHDLTVVQIKFSNNSKYLLSVSRDRSWKLYRQTFEQENNANSNLYELVRGIDTKNEYHTRIIWSCDWSHDDKYFITTSRDKRACIWHGSIDAQAEESNEIYSKPIFYKNEKYLELQDSITACSFAPDFTTNSTYLIAFGLDNGKIELYNWSVNEGFNKYASIEDRYEIELNFLTLDIMRNYI
jgi:elongator complex protein 2